MYTGSFALHVNLKCTAEQLDVFCFKDFWTCYYINALNGQNIKQLIQNTI